jgi:hypothetical protein
VTRKLSETPGRTINFRKNTFDSHSHKIGQIIVLSLFLDRLASGCPIMLYRTELWPKIFVVAVSLRNDIKVSDLY